MGTLLIALGLIVVMLVLGLGSSVLWMRPANRPTELPRQRSSTVAGSMTIGDDERAHAA